MKSSRIRTTVGAASAVVAIGLIGAPIAAADEDVAVTTATIGQQAKLVNGDVVQGWTITGLKPSSDAIPYLRRAHFGRPPRPMRPSRAPSSQWSRI